MRIYLVAKNRYGSDGANEITMKAPFILLRTGVSGETTVTVAEAGEVMGASRI